MGEAHDVEDPVQLVVVVRVARLDVLLAAVEDGLGREQLRKDAPNGPDVCGEAAHSQPRAGFF